MTSALSKFCDFLFSEYGVTRIQADVLEYNEASCKVLSRAGFEFEGRLKKRYKRENGIFDAFLYSLVK